MNRKRLIAGISILGVLVILLIAGVGFLLTRLRTQPRAQQRELITKLGYCNSQNAKPCIVSFSVDADGKMLVNLVIPSETYPDFYLTISNSTTENRYDCQPVEDFPTNVYCTGAEMYPGEVLQFTIHTIKDDAVLAEGQFAIIGLQLPNPEEEMTATPFGTESPVATEAPFETPTPFLLDFSTPFPTLEILTTPTPTISSYPNYP
ncbi:MAG: hypothetical protein ABI904_12045 [Chloroflexota bacterium]